MRYFLATLLAAVVILSPSASADEVYTFIVKKQEEKAQTRKGWNLTDWIAQRDRMKQQDLWLAMNTPTPYEFFFGGEHRSLSNPDGESDRRFQFGAFYRVFGVTLEHESRAKRYNAFANLRIYGLHQQGTNITLFGGIRSQSGQEEFRSAVAGASVTLYLTNFLGVEGSYRKYFDGTSGKDSYGRKGKQIEANGFIDLKFLRVYGGLIRTDFKPVRESGYQLGARFFF
jgi:hypothetical protein